MGKTMSQTAVPNRRLGLVLLLVTGLGLLLLWTLLKPVIGERYIIHRLGVGPEAQLTQTYGKLPAGTVIRLRPESNQLYRVFLPNQQGGANGRQPFRPESSGTSPAAASRRSPF